MNISYWKKFPEKNMMLQVIVDFDTNPGTVIDAIAHPLDYVVPVEVVE